jgi:hypothetical protein|tara:strand:+ start:2287 stop:2742 length:456 start_codon:yes stop_codon:yes gene_type:complete
MPTDYHYQLPQRGKLSDSRISWVTWEEETGEEVLYTTIILPKASHPVKLNHDSIWGYKGSPTINPHKIEILNETDHGLGEGFSTYQVVVHHDGGENSASMYTDTAVPHYISMWLQLPLEWSEQGLQSDGKAHLEISPQKKGYPLPKTAYPL